MPKPRARDIPDKTILGLVRLDIERGNPWASTWHIAEALPQFPPKVVASKLGIMVRRGRLDGSPSGSLLDRGDFRILKEIKDGEILRYVEDGKIYPCYMKYTWPPLRRKLANMMQRGILTGKLRGSRMRAWVGYRGAKPPGEEKDSAGSLAQAVSDGIANYLWNSRPLPTLQERTAKLREFWRWRDV